MEVYNAFDWTLMTSDSETFGMVTIESMAQGTPVIGSNAGGTSELLDFGNAGLLFETKNEIDLAEKMKLALEKKVLLSKEILSDATLKFNRIHVVEEVERLLKSSEKH